MKYIDEKFKEASPAETVERIKKILEDMGIETEEKWFDSGIDNCWSLSLSAIGGMPSSNGKGVSRELARASAYGEFIERLQGGLFFNKYQGIVKDPQMNLQNFASDVRYMTKEELKENGDWMDYLIQTYGPGITRDTIVKFCELYACTDEDRIPVIPFYSLFEDKYVYLPVGFVDQMYATNGCCAGNTRDEAWVHALSEMMERNAALKMLISGEAAPQIPEEVLKQYPVVMHIVNQIRAQGNFTIEMLDYSIGNGFPIVCTRLINKKNQAYRVNVAADPVLEIALERSLTEMLQGKHIEKFSVKHNGKILNHITEVSTVNNVINQLETGSGVYTVDAFANELTCKREPAQFADRSDSTNAELLNYLLELYKETGKPVYVRDFSFLGFPCYRFVVPGFSESVAVKLSDILPEKIAMESSKILKDIASADNNALGLVVAHSRLISTLYSRYTDFGKLAGVPLKAKANPMLTAITHSYVSYRLGDYPKAIKYLNGIERSQVIDEDTKGYFACVAQYLTMQNKGVTEDKIRLILSKFFDEKYVEMLYKNIEKDSNPYQSYLFKCDLNRCEQCRYRESCLYHECKALNIKVGNVYKNFVQGQFCD